MRCFADKSGATFPAIFALVPPSAAPSRLAPLLPAVVLGLLDAMATDEGQQLLVALREYRAVQAREYKRDKEGQFASGRSGTPDQFHDDAEHVRAAYDFDDPTTGMSARVTSVRSGGRDFNTHVDIEIRDRDGNRVGGATRDIHPSFELTVEHIGFTLERGVQGQGFAERWQAQAEDVYRAHGMREIHLTANEDVGGYAWARAGYDFADDRSRRQVAGKASRWAEKYGSDEDRREVTRLAGDLRATPLEYALIGHTDGATMWPGKKIMLYSLWEGVKRL